MRISDLEFRRVFFRSAQSCSVVLLNDSLASASLKPYCARISPQASVFLNLASSTLTASRKSLESWLNVKPPQLRAGRPSSPADRKSVVSGKRVPVRGYPGGRRIIKTKKRKVAKE